VKHGFFRKILTKGLPLLFLAAFGCGLAGCVTYTPSTLVIRRAGTLLDGGKL
jgi:hypothetical protein